MTDSAVIRSEAAVPARAGLSDRRLVVGAATMTAVSIAKVGVQFAMLPIMARLIGPEAYGLYALALPAVTFVLMIADGGLGNSLAREKPEAWEVWSSAFWAVHGVAVVLACGIVGWSFLLARITGQAELPPLMSVLSLSLMLLAGGIVPLALLFREGRLHVGAIADLVATLVGAGCGIVLALRGAGAWALAGQYVTIFAIRTLIVNVIAFRPPDFVFDLPSLRPHLLLGGAIVGAKLADYFGRMIETTLVGSLMGAGTLGFYGFGNQVPRFLTESVSNPLWAVLYVQGLQKPRDVVARAYCDFSRALGVVLFPTTMIAAVVSAPAIALFLGVAWDPLATPMAILLATSVFPTLAGLSSALMFAEGQGACWFWTSSGMIVARIVAVAAGSGFGLTAVAALLGIVNVAYFLVIAVGISRRIGVSARMLLGGLAVPFACAVATAAPCALLIDRLGTDLLMLAGVVLASLLAYAGLLVALERRRLAADLGKIMALVRR
jgi:PST family polysaccharide transporter